jgi:Ca-activated chloride channel family protein
MRTTLSLTALSLLAAFAGCAGNLEGERSLSGGNPSASGYPGYPGAAGGGGGTAGPAAYPPAPALNPASPTPPPGAPPPVVSPPAPPVPPMMMPPNNGGDRFNPPGTNPFVMTAHDPFSTFAVDVDTASYDIFRRDVNLGMIPQPFSVRLEEYVNYFAYEYPAPAANEEAPFRISVAAASQVFDRPSILLRVGVQAKKPPPFQKRPANLVFLVDVSGSMDQPNKLPLARQLMQDALQVLEPMDKVSIVTYAADTSVRLKPTAVSDAATIGQVIASLRAGGSTNGAGGLMLAYGEARAAFIPEGINHILLCTDGDFNVGPSSTKELVNIIREQRKTGVTLTVLGFGVGNLNDDLMEAVADAGNGIYGVISDADYARRYVRDKMLSTIEHVAKDMKIQVEFNADRVEAYRLLGYENRAIADGDFRSDGIDAGEIGAGHRVTALYEVVLDGGSVPVRTGAPVVLNGKPSDLPREVKPEDLVLVKVRWKGVQAAADSPAFEVNTSLGNEEIAEGLSEADPDLQWAAAVASFAEILKKSPYADRAQLPTIKRIADAQAGRDEERREFSTLLQRVLPLLGTP